MPRELEYFRDNLERLNERFSDKEMLQKKDVIAFTGLCYNTVVKLFPFKGNFISKVVLARELSRTEIPSKK